MLKILFYFMYSVLASSKYLAEGLKCINSFAQIPNTTNYKPTPVRPCALQVSPRPPLPCVLAFSGSPR